jgi:HSP20 family molecular chaperone IbpA
MDALRDGLDRLRDGPLAPALDLYTTSREIVASVALPGVQERDVAVSIAEEQVTVTCSTPDANERPGVRYVHRELNHGSFSRSFRLPLKVVPAGARASIKQGLMTLTLPVADADAPNCDDVVDMTLDGLRPAVVPTTRFRREGRGQRDRTR